MTVRFEPLIPDGDEARRLAEEELSRAVYAEAKPTAFDLWAREVGRFLQELFSGSGGGQLGPWWIAVAVVILVGALVVALLYWGVPRRSRRLAAQRFDLLGEQDGRSAAQLRADAERSAKAGDFAEATILRYRALARSLLERELIDPAPGATAQAIAREATAVFPAEAAALREAAWAFDDVRYLEHPGSAERYRQLADLDERLRHRSRELIGA